MSGEAWSDEENDLIVADYFAMLQDELSGKKYNKAAHNRDLQDKIDRNKGSIEFKHQNISAVLKGAGQSWINGYKPRFNIQSSLEDAVERWLAQNPDWADHSIGRSHRTGFNEAAQIFVRPAPTLSNQPPPVELEQTLRIAKKFDAAGRDERNRKLGEAGERLVLEFEQSELRAAGRHDLAKKIRWVSKEDGDGAGYDIASFTPDGKNRLLEVKTTTGWERTPFHITRNELAVAETKRSEWCLFRLWNFSKDPQAFELYPPLDQHVTLTPTTFQAGFH